MPGVGLDLDPAPPAGGGPAEFEFQDDPGALDLGLGLGEPPPPSADSGSGFDPSAEESAFDLPIAAATGVSLPTPEEIAGESVSDLPAVSGNPAADSGFDLPAPAGGAGDSGFDLPAPAGGAGDSAFDLPTPAGAAADSGFDLPSPTGGAGDSGLDLPTPAGELPAPASNLPRPAENLVEPASSLVEPATDLPGDGGLDLDLDVAANTERAPTPGAAVDETEMARPETAPRPAQLERRDLPTGVHGHMASPVPARPPRKLDKKLVGGVLGALLLGGGGAAAFSMGLIGGEETITDEPRKKRKKAAVGEAMPRSAPFLAALDKDHPSDYQKALAIAEAAGDLAGQAEAAALIHLRYGPDPAALGQAEGFLESIKDNPEPFVKRVVGLVALAKGDKAAAAAALTDEHPRTQLYAAWLALSQGNFTKAVELADKASSVRSEDLGAEFTSLEALLEQDQKEGLAGLRSAREKYPDHPGLALTNLRNLIKSGLLAEAGEAADSLPSPGAAGEGYRASILIERAELAASRGAYGKADRLLEQAASLNKKAQAPRLGRLHILENNELVAELRSEIEIFLRDFPKSNEGHLINARLQVSIGEADKALAALKKMGKGFENNARALLIKGEVQAMTNEFEGARQTLGKAREMDPYLYEATAVEAQMLRRANREIDAQEIMDKHIAALKEQPGRGAASALSHLYDIQAQQARQLGELDKALKFSRAAYKAAPFDNTTTLAHAEMLILLGKRKEGEGLLRELYARTGGFPGLAGPLGRAYLRLNELEALDQLLAGAELERNDTPHDVILTGALLKLRQGKGDEAIALCDRVLQSDPASQRAHLVRAEIMLARGEPGTALVDVEQARPATPTAEFEYWFGRALEANEQQKEALDAYERSVDLDSENDEAHVYFGRLLAEQGSPKAALEHLMPPLKRRPKAYPWAWVAVARAHYDLNDRGKAAANYKKALSLDPKLFDAHYWLARMAGDRNDQGSALKHLRNAVEVGSPERDGAYLADAYRRLGDAYRSGGDKEKAKAAYEKFLEFASTGASGRDSVVRILQELG